ncbi:hypothetical protein [Pseudomonas sp. S9]|uniref:hypothetical protein n=1 Tax=Pseudomonas sp. S9 TaxID=686578 RepID=UPI001110985D|nr:hypothetical protein [Pseudomonas sp. S9]
MAKDPNDFSETTKTKVLKRAGYTCSFPKCNLRLVGPHSDADGKGTVSTSEVSHIRGARPAENNRFDVYMTPEERSHHSNAIALCRTHGKLIDSDEDTYFVKLLHEWKDAHEEKIRLMQSGEYVPDDEVNKSYDKCTDNELKEDRVHRFQLIENENKKKQEYCKKVAMIPVATTLALVIWYLIIGSFHILMFPIGFVLIGAPVKIIVDILEKDNEFQIRQRLSIKEINYRLQERGVE